jgi:hypothetical protein
MRFLAFDWSASVPLAADAESRASETLALQSSVDNFLDQFRNFRGFIANLI